MNRVLLDCHDARKAFGRGPALIVAVGGVSLQVEGGEVVGVIGPNGAGKSTLLRLVAGESIPDSGWVRVVGRPPTSREGRAAVGYAADPPVIPPELSGLEWLRYVASHRSQSRAERERRVLWAMELTGLDGALERRSATYSRGTMHRVALAAAAVAGVRLLVLDELLSGVDPLAQAALRRHLHTLAAAGRAILIASHDLVGLERIATRVVVMLHGLVRADVPMARVLQRRVAELSFSPPRAPSAVRMLDRFPGSRATENGVAVPLRRGLTIEQVLAVCRAERLPVAASRVRHGALEDMLIAAVPASSDDCSR